MIALAVVGWEVFTWSLFGVALSSGNQVAAFICGAAALVGPIVFIPLMTRVRPDKRTYGDVMREQQRRADVKRRREERR